MLIAPSHVPNRAAVVEFRNNLQVGGKPFFMRGIRYSDTPLKTLRDAGFNTLWLDYATPTPLVEEAVNLGFWVVPALPVTGKDPRLASPEGLAEAIRRFLSGDAVLFWHLGGGLAREQVDQVAAAAQAVRLADPGRPLGLDAWDGLRPYSRMVDLLGVHRWPLMTSLELPQYRQWLEQRLLLARPGTFLWTWVQTQLPDWFTTLVYEQPGSAGFQEPDRPATGADPPVDVYGPGGRLPRPGVLVGPFPGRQPPGPRPLAGPGHPQPGDGAAGTAAGDGGDAPLDRHVRSGHQGSRHAHGSRHLVLPMWLGNGAQFVPGQAAVAKLTMVVPEVSSGMQAWEVCPAEVRSLRTERVVGGTQVTLPEFGLTAAVVFTGDNSPTGLVVRFQEQVRRMRPLAAQWARDQAEVELDKVTRVEGELEQAGHTLPDGQALMDDARQRLQQLCGSLEQ